MPIGAKSATHMPTERPYRYDSLDALYGRAKDHWGNHHLLRAILDELAHRTTHAAGKLRQEISEQVAFLRDIERREGDEEPAATKGPSATALAEELIRLRAEKESAEKRVAELQSTLLQARDTIRWQEQKLASGSAKNGNPLYRRVGLDEDCPDFVVKAARTAYRKQLHPDTRPVHEKAEAERRFKEAEGVFDTIYALRKL